NAKEYRDWAQPIADRCGGLVVTPEFDSQRFPSGDYQFGGLLTRAGELRPREEWTWSVIPAVVAAVRTAEKRPVMPYYLIGHSAGRRNWPNGAAGSFAGGWSRRMASPTWPRRCSRTPGATRRSSARRSDAWHPTACSFTARCCLS